MPAHDFFLLILSPVVTLSSSVTLTSFYNLCLTAYGVVLSDVANQLHFAT